MDRSSSVVECMDSMDYGFRGLVNCFCQQLQRATPLAGSIFGELFCIFLSKIRAFQISGKTLTNAMRPLPCGASAIMVEVDGKPPLPSFSRITIEFPE